MRGRRFGLVATLVGCAALASAPASPAHYDIDKHRWWFGGNTYGASGDTEKVDPVNMLFYPEATSRGQIDTHFNEHWGANDEWIEHHNLGDVPFSGDLCRGDQFVKFRRSASGSSWEYLPTDFHGAGVGRSEGECTNRFHIRFWGDARHQEMSGETHSTARSWIVAGAHYEDTVRPEEREAGHEPALDWDVVEHRVVRRMRPHAYDLRWKCLPNSFGLYQGFWSDGRITRLSMRHGSGATNNSTQGTC